MSTVKKTIGRKLAWKLRLVMVSNGINTATELKRRLDRYGHEITTTHAARIVNALPQRISTDLLEALINVLGCLPGDLIVAEDVPDETETEVVAPTINNVRPIGKKSDSGVVRKLPKRAKVVAMDDDTNYFGPRALTLPKPMFDENPEK